MTIQELKFAALMQLPVEINHYGFYDIEFRAVGTEWKITEKGMCKELGIVVDSTGKEYRVPPEQVFLMSAYEGPTDATQYAREIAARRILGLDEVPSALKPA